MRVIATADVKLDVRVTVDSGLTPNDTIEKVREACKRAAEQAVLRELTAYEVSCSVVDVRNINVRETR